MSQGSSVSVVVPTRNGADTLGRLFEGLRRQRLDPPAELVVVDSGSSDGTIELARRYADQLISVPSDEFDHGATRNLAIKAAGGDFVVLMVQDAEPSSETLLHELTAPLHTDASVAGVFARQIPRPEASRITRHYLTRWVAAGDQPRTAQLTGPTALDALTPSQRLDLCAFDNVCACVRRSSWEAHPFPRIPIAEDLAWARVILLAGQRLVYNPRAVVVHSHDRSVAYEFVRTRQLHHQLFELFGLRAIPTWRHLVRAVAGSLVLHLKLERSNPRRLARAIGLALAWPGGQFLGGRDAARRAAGRSQGATR